MNSPESKTKNNASSSVNVLFIFKAREELQNYFNEKLNVLTNIKLIFPSDLSEESLFGLASTADIIVGWRPSKELLLASKKLTLFFNPGAGVQHLIKLIVGSKKYSKLIKQVMVVL